MRVGPILLSNMYHVHVLFFLQENFHLLFHSKQPSYKSGELQCKKNFKRTHGSPISLVVAMDALHALMPFLRVQAE